VRRRERQRIRTGGVDGVGEGAPGGREFVRPPCTGALGRCFEVVELAVQGSNAGSELPHASATAATRVAAAA